MNIRPGAPIQVEIEGISLYKYAPSKQRHSDLNHTQGSCNMYKIQTFNQIAEKGLACLPEDNYSVSSEQNEPDAILVRSSKLSMNNVSPNLKAVARAGAGVNNIPVEDYTRAGIVVFNTPGANANAVKELLICGMLMASRNIMASAAWTSQLDKSLSDAELNALIEKEKKQFRGNELAGKTLGVVGLGAIGSMVANAALGLGMRVLGYDPAISVDSAWRLTNQVEKQENLASLVAQSDFVSLHLPVLESTRNLIDHKIINSFKKGATLLNLSRAAIVDNQALLEGLNDDRIACYVTDFPSSEFIGRNDTLLFPHIGASTTEAEENCAVMAAMQLRNFLEDGNITNSVNFPALTLERNSGTRLAIVNINVPGMLGQILSVLADRDINVIDMINKSRDDIAYNLIDIEADAGPELIADIQAIEHVCRVWVL